MEDISIGQTSPSVFCAMFLAHFHRDLYLVHDSMGSNCSECSFQPETCVGVQFMG